MALLTNINGKFSVSDAGAVRFNDAFTFPTSDGTSNYFLQTNGSGQLAWAAGPTGTVKGTGTATRVAFWSANDTISSSADLYWDNTNKRLGIGVAAPAALLEINGTGDAIRIESENTGAGGAQVDLLHFSPSPADNDTMGYINMGGYYSGTNSAYFSSIRTVATDISAREGEIQFWTVDTTLKQRMVIDKNGNVGIGNEGTGVVLTGKGLGIQNIGQDTTASMRLTGHNATGNPGVATYTELKHYGDTLSFGINHNGGTDVMTINSSKQVTFSGLVSGVTPTAAANFATKAYVDAHPGGTVTGTGAASRVAYWTTTSNISYNDDFKYDGFRKIALGGDIETSLSDFCTIEIGNVGMILSEKADSQYNTMSVSSNAYYTTAWKYKTASVVGANNFSLYQGKFIFSTAPAPSAAGDNITWSTKMTILNNGNVGIGVTDPTNYKLEVNGNVKGDSFGTDENTTARIFAPSGAAYNGSGSQTGYLIMELPDNGAGGVNNMMSGVIRVFDYAFGESCDVHFAGYWYSGYNWTNCTAFVINEAGVERNFNIRFGSGTGSAGANTRPYIAIGEATSAWSYCKFSVTEYTSGHSNMNLYKWNSGWAASLSATLPGSALRTVTNTQTNNWKRSNNDLYSGNSGSVGIGVTSPAVKLDVDGDIRRSGITSGGYIELGSLPGYPANAYQSLTSGGSLHFANNGKYCAFLEGNDTYFGVVNNSSQTKVFFATGSQNSYLAGSGNFGIGVTSPSTKVHIELNNLAGATVYNTAYTQLTIENSGSAGIQINSATYGIIYFGDASSPISGQWLYVHSSDTYLWMTAAVTTMSLNATALTVKGDIVAYGSPSDKRLKENIKPIESALDKVSKLQGVTFDWKKQNPQDDKELTRNWKNDIGFIAQDVQKVVPELVRENEDGMLSMRHQGIAPILLEAIKELKAEIEELKLNNCNCK